jgi:hypothetical protein
MDSIVPLLALATILGGVVTLAWYSRLGKEEKEKADRRAGEYARQLFGKHLDQLTAAEAKTVASLLTNPPGNLTGAVARQDPRPSSRVGDNHARHASRTIIARRKTNMTAKMAKSRNILGDLLEGARNVFTVPDFIPSDPDLDNRNEVLAHLADFLSEHLGCAAPVARDAANRLCGEHDKTLLAKGKPCSPDLLKQARILLRAVRVHYQFQDNRQTHRITIIRFLAGNQPAERRVVVLLDWDLLPREVRDERLRHGATEVAFELYPTEAENL